MSIVLSRLRTYFSIPSLAYLYHAAKHFCSSASNLLKCPEIALVVAILILTHFSGLPLLLPVPALIEGNARDTGIGDESVAGPKKKVIHLVASPKRRRENSLIK